jgi:hypothetical protein
VRLCILLLFLCLHILPKLNPQALLRQLQLL